jgi:hypothetical protein
LEAKGLTAVEIDDAIRQASLSQPARTPLQSYQGQYPQQMYGTVPYAQLPSGQWDWRDYFVRCSLCVVIVCSLIYRR